MRIAWCIYGQPRNFEEGYQNITKFINNENNKNHKFDFYIHCWFDESQANQYYSSSYRNENNLLIISNTNTTILELYKPVDFLFEKTKIFNTEILNNSLIDINTIQPLRKHNYSNTLSNLYSKFKVSKILNQNINDSNYYDLIISTRFDYLNEFIINLDTIDKSKLNIIKLTDSRMIINDSYIITNLSIYNKYSEAINNLDKIINDTHIMEKCITYTNSFEFIPEVILFANLIYYYGDNIVNITSFRNDMLNFLK
jgi:hypothetical protein